MKNTYKDVRSRIERKIELEARMLEDHSASRIKRKLIEDWTSNRQYCWDANRKAFVDKNQKDLEIKK